MDASFFCVIFLIFTSNPTIMSVMLEKNSLEMLKESLTTKIKQKHIATKVDKEIKHKKLD